MTLRCRSCEGLAACQASALSMAATPDATKLLYDIVHHVKTAPSGEVTPTTIAPIFRFLRPAKIPKSERPTTADRERVNLATDALKAFVEVGSSEHMLSTPALIARILEPDGWPSIWKWLQFMREKCVLQKSYGEDACTSAVIGIATTLEVLRRHTNLRIAVTTTSGVLELIMEQWLHASDHARLGTNLSDAGYHYIQSRLMLALGGLLESTDATPKSPVGPQIFGPQILAGAGGDSKLVATTALSRLRTSVADANAPETDVGPHLMLMYNLSGQCQAIHLALANEGLIPVIIEVLSWCNARPAQAKPANTLNECYRNLLRVFYSTNGAVWVVQALDSGLITAMLRSGSWLATVDPTDFAVELCERFLDEVLSKYTVFRSVLRAVRRALRQVEKRRLGTKAVVGCLWDAWQKFKAFAEVRLGMLDLWDERGGRAASEACTYPKVRAFCSQTMYISHPRHSVQTQNSTTIR
ncbi:hypothetical protein PLICRDRAFT_436681 [Plicaturopsis crispa FD-325 SS-3]|uniref:Uncharacterized protein n=1 Tax=Plicaturopsis crispa FD-325 SS-3 TaxID=944288 RepID=A0A0C9T781_PLICR|nr:hypothetical protein PLICRDRAFT_436681 [Plicaturopsis crispa FD-325 SS-3]